MKNYNSPNRVHLIDELRGFAIICMVVYHLFYDLVAIFNVNILLFYSPFIQTLVPIFVFIFVFISGTASAYSKNNLVRGLKCFALGMLMTAFTYFFMRDQLIVFGILHMLGTSMMLYGIYEIAVRHFKRKYAPAKSPQKKRQQYCLVIIIGIIFFLLTYNVADGYLGIGSLLKVKLPEEIYNLGFLFPLGFVSSNFFSSDYFALLPWFFCFAAGTGFGKLLKQGNMPRFLYKSHLKPLAFIGRNTLIIYILHQPVVYGILYLIFMNK